MPQQNHMSKVARDISTEPPIGGWNTRDSLDNIPPTDAIVIDNWTCGLGSISVRKGNLDHSHSLAFEGHDPGPVQTLMKYDSGQQQKLFAADGGIIWDATAPGEASESWQFIEDPIGSSGVPPSDPEPFSNNIYSWTNFRGGLGDEQNGYLVAVNGSEGVAYFNNPAIPFGESEPLGFGWWNLDLSVEAIGCFNFKNRMYYWSANSQSIWYTELYAVAGTLYEVQLGGVGQFGGSVITIESVTHDGGSGTDDYLVIYMSGGEVLVYQGSYPDDEADWAIIGIFNPGLPMGPRGFAKFGGDLMMMTDLDILPMSKLLKGVEAAADLTKISGAMQRVAPLRGNFGFQVELYPPAKLMVFNIPQGAGFAQFVMNTITGAWSRWSDLQSYCWLEYEGSLYFGTDYGNVYEAEQGNADTKYTPYDNGPTPYNYYDANPESFGQASDTGPDDPVEFTAVISANFYDRFGQYRANDFVRLQVGDALRMDAVISEASLEMTISKITFNSTFATFYGAETAKVGSFVNGAPVEVDTSGASGDEVFYESVPIKSDIQTAWLRFAQEELKQIDAVKLYLRSTAPVFKTIQTKSDYQDFTVFDYPKESVGYNTPWSGEWVPADPFPATIPDPTTWWSDEYRAPPLNSNPTTPVNDRTGRAGDGVSTKWSVAPSIVERWDIVSGVGRAVSLWMKLNTSIQVEWILTFWHAKIGSRM